MKTVPGTFGNWVKPEASGLGKLSGLATILLFVGLVSVVIVQSIFGFLEAFIVLVLFASVIALFTVRDRYGYSLAEKIGGHVIFWRAKRRGENLYRSGVFGGSPWATFQLPGILASTKIAEFEDAYKRPFAIIHSPSVSTYSVVLASEPDGEALVDEDQIELWVARYGMWLASLGQEQGLVGAQVIVETAPDTGTRLKQEILNNIAQSASPVALRMLEEVQHAYPSGSALVRVYVTLTYEAAVRKGMRKRAMDDVARDFATRLPGLTQALAGTGAGMVRPVKASELRKIIRCAYDPQAEALFDEAALTGQEVDLGWEDCGPVSTDARRGDYIHDSGVSVSWVMSDAPRGLVQSNVLARLLAPQPTIPRKRVALLYRPIDAARTATIVEADRARASVRYTGSKTGNARAAIALAKADATAKEEARGAGLENFGMVITATGTFSSDMAEIEAIVESLAASSRLQIRKAWGGQDAAFVFGLPVGVVPLKFSPVSETLKEAL
ncbi:SCO6880 family protein [Trueperella pyogenes]|uniref:SCO6880 family protein n=1 Tax=Trueperella pyogenes TaxID=1661 RepID=UPI00339D84BF